MKEPYDYADIANANRHKNGQHLSTALMRINRDIGKIKTDRLVIESMPPLVTPPGFISLRLREAAAIIYNIAVAMASPGNPNPPDPPYTPNDLCIIYKHLEDKLQISQSVALAVSPPTGGTADIYIRDTKCDTGIEPNPDQGPMWASPDIWIRQDGDDELAHENAEYKASGEPNYIYVRVNGRGCQETSEMVLRVYWSKAGLRLKWPDDWEDFYIDNVLAGDEITPKDGIPIAPISVGEELIFKLPWVVPNPDDFETDKHHFCLLARLHPLPTADPIPDDMHVPETKRVNVNARNNNNIAWKNFSILDEDPSNEPPPTSVFVGCGNKSKHGQLRVQSTKLPLEKTIHDYGEVFLELREPLYTEWLNKGGQGQNFSLTPTGLIKVENEDFHLENLPLDQCNYRIVDVHFLPNLDARDCSFDLIQYNDHGVEMGGERFVYDPAAFAGNPVSFKNQGTTGLIRSQQIQLFPNPAKDLIQLRFAKTTPKSLQLSIYSSNGQQLFQQQIIDRPDEDHQIDVA
ncbi:MAG: hypothetical protein AAGD05_04870, partial [Bacteroidota bacterium]